MKMIKTFMPDEAYSGTKWEFGLMRLIDLRNLQYQAAKMVVCPLYFISQRNG